MSLNTKQNEQLLRGINPKRVLHLRGQPHLAGWDVKAHLTRIFGFEGWDKKIRSVELVFETHGLPDGSKKGWYVTYRCQMTLIIRDPSGNVVREIDGAATGSAENQPSRGDAHDLALKNSVTYALKVCATDLGDQFGLSLYNNGSTNPIIMQTLAGHDDVEQAVPDEINPDSDPETQPEQATVPVNGNGHAAGQTVRPATVPQPSGPQELDADAQPYADEAHEARTLAALKDINTRAREKHKLASLITNPSTGGTGGLGQYIGWRRRQLEEVDAALALLNDVAKRKRIDLGEVETQLKLITGKGIEEATPAEMRSAAEQMLAEVAA
jgi:hypothetical protein